jgi:negative regulator of sigma E activity
MLFTTIAVRMRPPLLRLTSLAAVVLALSTVTQPVRAQPSGSKQVVAASVKPLPLFNQPGDASPAKTVVPEGLPWPILEEKQDFFRISIDSRDYWVDSMQVRATRGVNAKCTVLSGKAAVPVGSTAGAGENACATR